MARMEPLDNVHLGRDLLHPSGIDQRNSSLVHAALAAGSDRRGGNYSARVPDRLHRQPLARLGRLGLQWNAWQHPRADLPTVHAVMAAGVSDRNCPG